MKFSEKWLRSLVNVDLSTEELAESLTMSGLEVEEITSRVANFQGVLIGQILTVKSHPNADKLQICEVNVGQDTLSIVCGAKNVSVGLKVPVAIVGALLPGSFKIKKAKLRGVDSFGMICSKDELELEENSSGIMELESDAPIGANFAEYLGLNDKVFNVFVTPNRADCLSVKGISCDVAAITGSDLNIPLTNEVPADIDYIFPIINEAELGCPIYYSRVIKDINKDASTPTFVKYRLKDAGIKIISPVVDLTNYVMLELGQPLHAFDLNKLNDHIKIRQAGVEKLVLLDGREIELKGSELVICDSKNVLALAGVMGGADSGISDTTSDILLESAFFNPDFISSSTKQHKLHTESSYRFERGVDSELQLKALNRITSLLLEVVGGKVGALNSSISDHKPQNVEIVLRKNRISQILGIEISDAKVVDILHRLKMQVKETGDMWQVIVPSFRFDIRLEVDLISEIARIHGYKQIPLKKFKADVKFSVGKKKEQLLKIRSLFSGKGYNEIITYNFVNLELQKMLSTEEAIPLVNPISQDLSVMRTNIFPGLVNTVLYNKHRQKENMRFFEIGSCFTKVEGQDRNFSFVSEERGELKIGQRLMLGGAITGKTPKTWSEKNRDISFFDIKNDLCSTIKLIFERNVEISFKPSSCIALKPGYCSDIYHSDKLLGSFGKVHPKISNELKLPENTYLFELNLSLFFSIEEKYKNVRFQSFSKFPSVIRDISIIIDENIPSQTVIDEIYSVNENFLKGVQIFDIFCSDFIGKGMRSIALCLVLQHDFRTLAEEEVNGFIEKVLKHLELKLDVKLRD